MLCSILWSRTEIGFPVSLKRVYEWPGREITESHLTLLMLVGRVSRLFGKYLSDPERTRGRADPVRKFPYSSSRTNHHNILGSVF